MSEETFRLVVTAGVLLASIAFVVQAIVAIAFYGAVRKMQAKVEQLTGTVEPLVAKAGPVIDKVGPVIDKAMPLLERVGPILDQASQTIERLGPVIDKSVVVIGQVGGVVEQAGPVVEGVRRVIENANLIIEDFRPRVVEFGDEAVSAARATREQVERIGELVSDVSGRAHARIEQIDHSVENTVEQVARKVYNVQHKTIRDYRTSTFYG